MKYRVEMLAFEDARGTAGFREVDVPDEEFSSIASKSVNELLERIFYWGQNDFQPKPFPSVSVGDVVHLTTVGGHTRYFLVSGVGFTELTAESYQKYKAMDPSDRRMYGLKGEA